jgi:hypothetical protein
LVLSYCQSFLYFPSLNPLLISPTDSNRNFSDHINGTGIAFTRYNVLYKPELTSFDGTGLSGLIELHLNDNQLTTLDITGLNVLQYLYVDDNLLTPSANNSLLTQLAANELANDWDTGEFYTTGGRTSAGTTDYDYLIANGWIIVGADLVAPPSSSGKIRVRGITQQNP